MRESSLLVFDGPDSKEVRGGAGCLTCVCGNCQDCSPTRGKSIKSRPRMFGRVLGFVTQRIGLSQRRIELETVMAYEFDPLVHRMVDKIGWTEERAREGFESLKRFLWECATSPTSISPDKEIDEIWHNFILFTMDYHEFCTTLLGRFIHHIPKRRGELKAAQCSCSGRNCGERACKS